MIRTNFFALLYLLIFFLYSCNKSNETDFGCEPNCTEYFSVEFSIFLCDAEIDQTCQIDSSRTPIQSADIFLFETAEFRTHGNPILANGTTNSDGLATINGLEVGDYFIKIIASNLQQEKEIVVRINPNTVSPSKEEVFFVK